MAAVAALRKGMSEKRFVCSEVSNFRKDGKVLHNLLCLLPLLDSGRPPAPPSLLRWLGVQCDLDDKRRKEPGDEKFVAKWQEQVRGVCVWGGGGVGAGAGAWMGRWWWGVGGGRGLRVGLKYWLLRVLF